MVIRARGINLFKTLGPSAQNVHPVDTRIATDKESVALNAHSGANSKLFAPLCSSWAPVSTWIEDWVEKVPHPHPGSARHCPPLSPHLSSNSHTVAACPAGDLKAFSALKPEFRADRTPQPGLLAMAAPFLHPQWPSLLKEPWCGAWLLFPSIQVWCLYAHCVTHPQ